VERRRSRISPRPAPLLLLECPVPQRRWQQDGVDELNDAIGAFRHAFPRAEAGHGPAAAYDRYGRFRWETRWNDGQRDPLFGDDIIELDDDGRIRRVLSFNGAPESPRG
jgi:hypothetical protein